MLPCVVGLVGSGEDHRASHGFRDTPLLALAGPRAVDLERAIDLEEVVAVVVVVVRGIRAINERRRQVAQEDGGCLDVHPPAHGDESAQPLRPVMPVDLTRSRSVVHGEIDAVFDLPDEPALEVGDLLVGSREAAETVLQHVGVEQGDLECRLSARERSLVKLPHAVLVVVGDGVELLLVVTRVVADATGSNGVAFLRRAAPRLAAVEDGRDDGSVTVVISVVMSVTTVVGVVILSSGRCARDGPPVAFVGVSLALGVVAHRAAVCDPGDPLVHIYDCRRSLAALALPVGAVARKTRRAAVQLRLARVIKAGSDRVADAGVVRVRDESADPGRRGPGGRTPWSVGRQLRRRTDPPRRPSSARVVTAVVGVVIRRVRAFAQRRRVVILRVRSCAQRRRLLDAGVVEVTPGDHVGCGWHWCGCGCGCWRRCGCGCWCWCWCGCGLGRRPEPVALVGVASTSALPAPAAAERSAVRCLGPVRLARASECAALGAAVS